MYNSGTQPSSTHDGSSLFSKKIARFGGGHHRSLTRPSTANRADGADNIATQERNEATVPHDSTPYLGKPGPTYKPSVPKASKPPRTFRRKPIPFFDASNDLHSSPERQPEVPRTGSRPPVSLESTSPKHRRSWTRPPPENQSTISSTTSSTSQGHTTDDEAVASAGHYSNMLLAMVSRDTAPSKTSGPGAVPGATGVNGLHGSMGPSLETITYQHIQEMASKRISTLDYLRKAHEGRVYWFNTVLFAKQDLARMPYFDSRKLTRRATNYILLGLSVPTIIDLHGSNALEFLRALNSLFAEFETFQQIHPADGSTSSLSRARIPQMLKRATGTSTSKVRRTSSAAEIGLPYGSDNYDLKSAGGSMTSSLPSSSATSFPNNENELLPGEEYTYLLTPSLPFELDFYQTFATLCDVLIDCYTRLTELVGSSKDCGPHVAEAFTKADARVRKVIVQGVVKEFEDSSRSGVKSEVAGVGKVVLGGLM